MIEHHSASPQPRQCIDTHIRSRGNYYSRLAASLGLAVLGFACVPAMAQILGTASKFAVLAATSGVTNTGSTVVTGSVGVYPAAAISGFPPGLIVPGTGTFHAADSVAQQAQADQLAAYGVLAGLSGASIAPGLGGQVLVPGVYNAGAANLTGTLTLNGPGRYVFQATSLTTASGPGGSIVSLTNGASPCDVWWQVSSSASIGTFSVIKGNILALTSITIDTGADLQGRALVQTGAVTLAGNTVSACSGGSFPGYNVPALAGANTTGVPTLSQWAIILLTSLMALGGLAAMRKKID